MDQPFESKSSSRFEDFGKKVDERFSQALPRVEEEVKKVGEPENAKKELPKLKTEA